MYVRDAGMSGSERRADMMDTTSNLMDLLRQKTAILVKMFNRCFASNGRGVMCASCEFREECERERTIEKAVDWG